MGMVFGKATPGIAGIGPGMAQGVSVAKGIQDIWNEQEERPLRRKAQELQIANAERQGKLADIELKTAQEKEAWLNSNWDYTKEQNYIEAGPEFKKQIDVAVSSIPEHLRKTNRGKAFLMENLDSNTKLLEAGIKDKQFQVEKRVKDLSDQYNVLKNSPNPLDQKKAETLLPQMEVANEELKTTKERVSDAIGEVSMLKAYNSLDERDKKVLKPFLDAKDQKGFRETLAKLSMKDPANNLPALEHLCKLGDNAACLAAKEFKDFEIHMERASASGRGGSAKPINRAQWQSLSDALTQRFFGDELVGFQMKENMEASGKVGPSIKDGLSNDMYGAYSEIMNYAVDNYENGEKNFNQAIENAISTYWTRRGGYDAKRFEGFKNKIKAPVPNKKGSSVVQSTTVKSNSQEPAYKKYL